MFNSEVIGTIKCSDKMIGLKAIYLLNKFNRDRQGVNLDIALKNSNTSNYITFQDFLANNAEMLTREGEDYPVHVVFGASCDYDLIDIIEEFPKYAQNDLEAVITYSTIDSLTEIASQDYNILQELKKSKDNIEVYYTEYSPDCDFILEVALTLNFGKDSLVSSKVTNHKVNRENMVRYMEIEPESIFDLTEESIREFFTLIGNPYSSRLVWIKKLPEDLQQEIINKVIEDRADESSFILTFDEMSDTLESVVESIYHRPEMIPYTRFEVTNHFLEIRDKIVNVFSNNEGLSFTVIRSKVNGSSNLPYKIIEAFITEGLSRYQIEDDALLSLIRGTYIYSSTKGLTEDSIKEVGKMITSVLRYMECQAKFSQK